MAVEHYKALRSWGQALGEIIILGSRKSPTLATFSLSTNTQPATDSQLKYRTKLHLS